MRLQQATQQAVETTLSDIFLPDISKQEED